MTVCMPDTIQKVCSIKYCHVSFFPADETDYFFTVSFCTATNPLPVPHDVFQCFLKGNRHNFYAKNSNIVFTANENTEKIREDSESFHAAFNRYSHPVYSRIY